METLLAQARRPADDMPVDHPNPNLDNVARVREPSQDPVWGTLNRQQREHAMTVFEATQRGEGGLFWLDGAAGTGKTHVTKLIMRSVAGFFNCPDAVLPCAFQGNTAANLCEGAMTLHHAFDLTVGTSGAARMQHKATTLQSYGGKLRLVVIDEISFVPADLFHQVELRLRKVLKPDGQAERPFGGLVVLVLGDFLQLPPVGGTDLATAAMRCDQPGAAMSQEARIGGMLWRRVQRLQLTEVMRANGCQIQLARLEGMRRELTLTGAHFDQAIPTAIRHITAAEIASGQYGLKSIHATNEARDAAGQLHLERAARMTGKRVFRWRIDIGEYAAELGNAPMVNIFFQLTPAAFENFLEGAPYMCRENVNTGFGLTNGCIGTAHAIYFNQRHLAQVRDAEALCAIDRNLFVVELPPDVRPEIFEVAFPIPQRVVDHGVVEAMPGRIENDKWIVPFRLGRIDDVKIGRTGKSFKKARGFQLTQAFSFTFHKAQGLTMNGVVLDLARPLRARGGDISWEAVYVGISRAPTNNDLRLLPPRPGVTTINYLIGKQPDATRVSFINPDAWNTQEGGDMRRRYDAPAAAAAPARRGRAAAAPAMAAAPNRRQRAADAEDAGPAEEVPRPRQRRVR